MKKADENGIRALLRQTFELETDKKKAEQAETHAPTVQVLQKINDLVSMKDKRDTSVPDLSYEKLLAEVKRRKGSRAKQWVKAGRLKKMYVIAALTAASITLLFLRTLFFPVDLPAYKLISWKGSPKIITGKKMIALKPGGRLNGSLTISTGDSDLVVLGLNDTRLYINKNTKFNLSGISGEIKAMKSTAGLSQGLVVFSLKEKSFKHFKVKTPHGKVSVIGTIFCLEVSEKHTKVAVLRGKVSVKISKEDKKTILEADNGAVMTHKTIKREHYLQKSEELRYVLKEMRHLLLLGKQIGESKNKKSNRSDFNNKKSKSGSAIHKKRSKNGESSKKIKKREIKITEKLFLKNGAIISGQIYYRSKTVVKIRSTLGDLTVPLSKIRRIEYVSK